VQSKRKVWKAEKQPLYRLNTQRNLGLQSGKTIQKREKSSVTKGTKVKIVKIKIMVKASQRGMN